MPCYLYRCACPLGRLILAGDGTALTGLWFADQKHFAASLPADAAAAARRLAEAPDPAPAAAARQPARPPEAGPAFLFFPDPAPAEGAGPAANGLLPRPAASVPRAAANPAVFCAAPSDGQAARTTALSAPENRPAVFRQTEAWLNAYFAGRDPGAPPPLRPAGTPFQQAVWAALCRIPYGQTTSYGALARQLAEAPALHPGAAAGRLPPADEAPAAAGGSRYGGPGAAALVRRPGARAVGSAVGRNPISILIPCHRVLAADGRLTGYAGGLDRKAALLALERGQRLPL